MASVWYSVVSISYVVAIFIVSSYQVSCYGSKKFMKGLVIGHMLGMKKSAHHFPHYPHHYHHHMSMGAVGPAVIPAPIGPPVAVATPTSFALPMSAGASAFSINAGLTTGFGLPGAAAIGGVSPFGLVNPGFVAPAINPFALNGLSRRPRNNQSVIVPDLDESMSNSVSSFRSINPFALGTTGISPFTATNGIAPAANIFVTE